MKIFKKFSVFMLTLFFLSACSNEAEQLIAGHEKNSSDESVSPYTRSMEDAVKISESFMSKISSETRGVSRKVASIQKLQKNTTRSGSSDDKIDPKYYLINYENEGGFSLVGADTRMPYIYAISEEGHLDLNDTTFNEGLALFAASLFDQGITDIDTLTPPPTFPIEPIEPIEDEIIKVEKNEPLLSARCANGVRTIHST